MAESIRIPEPVKKPSDWRRFKSAFNFYLTAAEKDGKSDQVKIALLINCIGEQHIDVFNTFELDENSQKFEEVIKKFDTHFEPQVNIIYERYKLRNRKQQGGESIEDYITSLKSLALTCKYTDKEDQIRDTLVCGIRDPSSVEKLLREPKLTLKLAEEFLRAKELSENQTKLITTSETSVPKTLSTDALSKSAPTKRNTLSWQKNCSRCGTQHQPRTCSAYGKPCTYCGILNHFETVCRARQADSRSAQTKNTNYQRNDRTNTRHGETTSKYRNINTLEVDDDLSQIYLDSIQLRSKATKQPTVVEDWINPWFENILIEGKAVKFKLDPGADVTTLPKQHYLSLNLSAKLQHSNKRVSPYLSSALTVLGTIDVWIKAGSRQIGTKIYVLDGQGEDATPLLSRTDCLRLNLVKRLEANSISTLTPLTLNAIFEKFSEVFTPDRTKLPFCYHMKLKEDAKPIVEPVRSK